MIDHGTTTAEAASHEGGKRGRGGDLLYRWGTPSNYGFPGEQQLFGQHNAHWIEPGLPGAGHLLVFDNGDRNTRPFSTVVEIETPLQANGRYAFDTTTGFPPAGPVWQWETTPPESVFAAIISSAQRLASGDTLICDGTAGHFFEVTPSGDMVWSYKVSSSSSTSPVDVFRATRFEPGFKGLDGKTLTPAGPIDVELVPRTSDAPAPAF